MSSKRPTKSYLSSAKANAKLIPSQRKYLRRKADGSTLNRWEKAAITRAENKLRKLGTTRIVPLTAKQAKSLKNKDAIIGGGIRGVHLDQTTKDAKARIIKGELIVESDGRKYDYINVIPDLQAMLAKGEQLFAKGAKEVWTWTRHGRSKFGWPSFKDMVNHPSQSLPERWQHYKGVFSDDWFFGLVAVYG